MARSSSKKKQPILKSHSGSGKISYKARSTSQDLGSFCGKKSKLEEDEEEIN